MVVEIYLLKIPTKNQVMIIQLNHHRTLITLETLEMQKYHNSQAIINMKTNTLTANPLVQIYLEDQENHKDNLLINLANKINTITIVNRKALNK